MTQFANVERVDSVAGLEVLHQEMVILDHHDATVPVPSRHGVDGPADFDFWSFKRRGSQL